MSDPSVPVLLLGSGITVLGAMRALGRAGISSMVLGEDSHLLRRSRWYRRAPELASGTVEDYLRTLPHPSAVPVPCSDDWVRRIAEVRDPELRSRFPAPIPGPDVVDQLLDKGRFAALLEEKGIPHPRTAMVAEPADLESWCTPGVFFLKPRDSQGFMRRFGSKALWPRSGDDLARILAEVVAEGIGVMAQEYVPGPVTSHYFVDGYMDAQGWVPAVFTRRRLRMYPPDFGNSSYMRSVPVGDVEPAVATVSSLLADLGYRGMFSAEFKRDERDGLFKLLEVNARPWWFVEFAASCGVNFMELAYRDARGLPLTEVRAFREGRRLIHPYFDVSACMRAEPRRSRALMTFLASIPGAERPIFSWNDPIPAVAEFLSLSRGFLARKLRRGEHQ